MPQSVPKSLAREHVLQDLADLDAGTDHPFVAPTGCELVHDGRFYPPKSEWWVEVKTTGLGKHFSFCVTANEVRCSEDCPERFWLYRVFNFSRKARLYVVGGPISREFRLEPINYRASV